MTLALHPQARLVDAGTGRQVDGAELGRQVEAAAAALTRDAERRRAAGEPAGIVLALMPTEIPAIVRYLGALAAGRPVALLDPYLSRDRLAGYLDRFAPALVTGVDGRHGGPPAGYRAVEPAGLGPVWSRTAAGAVQPHPALALLLGTSGSTGNPKLVRLSGAALAANADAIARCLRIDPDEVAPTTLPLFYSYGLSVLNSHLLAGGTVLLERTGFLRPDFWTAVREHKATSLAAVPYQYEMLRRLRFDPAQHPLLRTLTQAGGRLRPELLADFAARAADAGTRMYVMYGQTEATARMTVLPPQRLVDKLGSVGLPVPGGAVSIEDGQVVYRGPNVMLGYAESAADLARGDVLGGVLRTGDLGRVDGDGFLFITGRQSRIGKVFGTRVNLDDVERHLTGAAPVAPSEPGADRAPAGGLGPVAAVAGDDRIHVFVEGATDGQARAARSELARFLGSHVSGLDVRSIDALPLLSTGKVDYRALEALR
ncbi:AMP-binding protein [Plantactinospora sp. KBS50]|uniref:AMP-binding protein n=1 Tax=Plantactinospora sp. KBS50 TaxID=2024580 RepID=UPI000BAAA81B|nr:AMP-binding protein [Plantactinospora sp. KBS50]ASW55273.1 AMP-dependent acyl-CoA synthetase [Plantactinospora sp. KBS50]